jgi:hypothetical protein
MFERLAFAHYAWQFERAFRSDRWDAVARCFDRDGVYIIDGTGTDYDGETRGRDAIVDLFRRMLDELDRRFDRRSPRLTAWPRVRGGELDLRWSVRYTLGADAAVLTGRSLCRFRAGRIARLHDTLRQAEVARWVELAERAA